MEQKLGRQLREGEVVHHINGNKVDNRPENLELCANQREHRRKHIKPPRFCDQCKVRPHRAKGLCHNCYENKKYKDDPAYRERIKARSRRTTKANAHIREAAA